MYYFFNKYNVIYHDLYTLSTPESAIFSPPPAAKFVQFCLSYCHQKDFYYTNVRIWA